MPCELVTPEAALTFLFQYLCVGYINLRLLCVLPTLIKHVHKPVKPLFNSPHL